jgi:hypothetical protein
VVSRNGARGNKKKEPESGLKEAPWTSRSNVTPTSPYFKIFLGFFLIQPINNQSAIHACMIWAFKSQVIKLLPVFSPPRNPAMGFLFFS